MRPQYVIELHLNDLAIFPHQINEVTDQMRAHLANDLAGR